MDWNTPSEWREFFSGYERCLDSNDSDSEDSDINVLEYSDGNVVMPRFGSGCTPEFSNGSGSPL